MKGRMESFAADRQMIAKKKEKKKKHPLITLSSVLHEYYACLCCCGEECILDLVVCSVRFPSSVGEKDFPV